MLEKILLSDFTEEELLKCVPELEEIKHFKKGKVLKHTILAIKNSPLDLELRLALLFHDIGKPKVYTRINGEDKYPMHQVVSEQIARRILGNYPFKNKVDLELIYTLIREHMNTRINGEDKYPMHQVVSEQIARRILGNYPFKNKVDLELIYTLIREHMNKRAKTSTDKAITRLYNRVGENAFPKLLEFFKADVMGYSKPNLSLFEKVEENIQKWKNKDRTVFKASEYYAVNGYDLLELGYKGKELGKALTYLQSLVDKDFSLNDKEILLNILKTKEKDDGFIE